MHVSSRSGQQNPIYGVEESIDVGNTRTTGKHQREGVHDFADASQIVFPNMLDLQDVMNRMSAPNNAHYWFAHYRPVPMDTTIRKMMWDLMDVDTIPADDCAFAGSGRKRILGRNGA